MASLSPADIASWTRTGSAQRETAGASRMNGRSGTSFSLHAEKPATPSPGVERRRDVRAPSASEAASARSGSDTEGSAKAPPADTKAPDHAPLRQRSDDTSAHPKHEKDVTDSEASGSAPSAAVSDDAEAAADPVDESPHEDDASAQSNETVPEMASQPPAPAPPSTATPSGTAPTGAVPPDGGAAAQAEGPSGVEPGRTATGVNELGSDVQGAPGGTSAQSFEAALAAAQADLASSLQDADLPYGQGGSVQSQISATSPTAEAKPAATTAPTPQAMPSVPLGAVPMTIGLRALGATSRFEIRLDPIELGRIDVALDIDRTRGAVAASLVVDRPETLALLQRDASSLQQALSQAGLDASQGIALSLRGGNQGGRNGHDTDLKQPGGSSATGLATDTAPGIEAMPLRALRAIGGIDIRI